MCLCCDKGEGVLCKECLKVGQRSPLIKCLKCEAYSCVPPSQNPDYGVLEMGDEQTKMYPVVSIMLFIWGCPVCELKLEKSTYLDEFTFKSKYR